MKVFVGTKIVMAAPMSDKEFQSYVGREIMTHDFPKEGYKVIYEDGYESWAPKEVFERCYREITISEKKLTNNDNS